MKPALLVIDLQHWFFKDNAPVYSRHEGEKKVNKLIYNTNKLIDYFKEKELPIIHILTVYRKDGSTRDLWSKRNYKDRPRKNP